MNATCVRWEHTMRVIGLNEDVKEHGPCRERYRVARVVLEGDDGTCGEVLTALHDAPKIGDLFRVTFERWQG